MPHAQSPAWVVADEKLMWLNIMVPNCEGIAIRRMAWKEAWTENVNEGRGDKQNAGIQTVFYAD